MKYLKITVLAFFITLVLSSVGVNATMYTISELKIPIASGLATSGQVTKYDSGGYHMLRKFECKDNITGDQWAIMGYIRDLVGGGNVSVRKELVKGQNVVFDSYTTGAGTFYTAYFSKKTLPTTATYWGYWTIDYNK